MTTDQLMAPDAPRQAASNVSDHESMTVRVVPIDESVFAHVSPVYWQWRELCERDPQSRVTQHPDFVLAELQYASGLDRHPPVLVTCQSESSLSAAAVLVPKSTAGEKRFGPAWSLNGYRLAGNRVAGRIPSAVESDFVSTISDHLSQTRADFLLVEDVETSDRLLDLLGGPHSPLTTYRPAAAQKRHRIVMPATFDEYMSKFTSRTRSTLRRKLRKFGDCQLERITELDQLPDFLSAAHEISRNSWQSDLLGLRIHDDEREIECFTRLVGLQALRAYLLWHDGNPVSFCIGTQFNGVFDYEEVAYDRQYAKSSPGQVLVLKMIEDLFASNTPQVFDFGGGDAEYKRQFSNSESESGSVWLLRPGVRSKVIRSYLDGRRMLGQAARTALQHSGLKDHIRRLTRRGVGRKTD